MVKLVLFIIIGSIIGFLFIANIMYATDIGMKTIKNWYQNTEGFYHLVSQFFIIATHPLMQTFLAFGMILMGIRVIFIA